MKSKWHNISIRSESFAELLELQRRLPIRASIPQLIEWLIKVGQKKAVFSYHLPTERHLFNSSQ